MWPDQVLRREHLALESVALSSARPDSARNSDENIPIWTSYNFLYGMLRLFGLSTSFLNFADVINGIC